VDHRDRFGNTPLWRAVFDSRGEVATAELLLQAGANPDNVNEAGTTPRDLAKRMAAEAVVRVFRDPR
jgi:ankyrin repeat protein